MEEPFFFLKPTTSYVRAPDPIQIPPDTHVEHELELGVVIGEAAGRNIPASRAMTAVAGFCVAIDLTARHIQKEASRRGRPWTVSKGYDTFCPVRY